MVLRIQVTPDRARFVVRDIAEGSRTHIRFYALLITASMIASFGLIANSTAVIIGAMLVSPLMTPIFGVALGMLRGNPRLLMRAVTTEVIGVVLAIGSAYLIGLTQVTAGEATPEMLARTQPNLMDLLVAVFAGFAGTYALLDARISPALPGVAIATAIVPPLSTCGLCLALGAWSGAAGALLLFAANFVSILVVALITFGLAGLGRWHVMTWRERLRRYAPTVAAFVCMAVVLTNSLLGIVRDRTIESKIRKTLTAQLSLDHSAQLEEFLHGSRDGRVQVLAIVRSQRTVQPGRVSSLQRSLRETVGEPVDLVVRTVRSRDVSPHGSSLLFARPDLDGQILRELQVDEAARESLATQVLREEFQDEPGFELTRIEYGESLQGFGIVVAYVNTIRRLSRQEIAGVEGELRQRFEDDRLMFFLRINAAKLENAKGPVRVEWDSVGDATPEEVERTPKIEATVRRVIADSFKVLPLHVHFNYEQGHWRVLVEVVGPEPLTPAETESVQASVNSELSTNVEVLIWYRNEYVVSSGGYTTFEALVDPNLLRRSQMLRKMFRSDVANASKSKP